MKTDPNYLSDCHNAAVYVVGTGEGTNHYECLECKQSCNFHPATPTNTIDNIEELLKPLFTEYSDDCTLCGHNRSYHYWNGAGNPENAAYDSCKYKGCDCDGVFDEHGYLIEQTAENVQQEPLNKLLAAINKTIMDECLASLPEKMVQTKEESDSDWFYGHGWNTAIDAARQQITKKYGRADDE